MPQAGKGVRGKAAGPVPASALSIPERGSAPSLGGHSGNSVLNVVGDRATIETVGAHMQRRAFGDNG